MKTTSILRMLVVLFAMILTFVVTANAATKASADLKTRVIGAIGNYYVEPFKVSTDANGKVEIKGDVTTLYDRMKIFDIVSEVPGVREIEDLVNVDTPTVLDKILEATIQHAMKENATILEPDRITVRVNNGVVFFTGEVSYYREKLMATTIASWEKGVKAVENELKVMSPNVARSDENLNIVLHEIAQHHFSLDKKIDLSVHDGVVTMRGEAVRLWDKRKMEEEFRKVMGVKQVINDLTVR